MAAENETELAGPATGATDFLIKVVGWRGFPWGAGPANDSADATDDAAALRPLRLGAEDEEGEEEGPWTHTPFKSRSRYTFFVDNYSRTCPASPVPICPATHVLFRPALIPGPAFPPCTSAPSPVLLLCSVGAAN